MFCIFTTYVVLMIMIYVFLDLGNGHQEAPDFNPSCSGEALHPGPAQTSQIPSEQTSVNQGLHASISLVSPVNNLSFWPCFKKRV